LNLCLNIPQKQTKKGQLKSLEPIIFESLQKILTDLITYLRRKSNKILVFGRIIFLKLTL